jgi:hypothetical protein
MNNTFEVTYWDVDDHTGNVEIHFYLNDDFQEKKYTMQHFTDFWKTCGKNIGYDIDHSAYRVSLYNYLVTDFKSSQKEVYEFLEFQFNNKA